jgi:hypothetical protein
MVETVARRLPVLALVALMLAGGVGVLTARILAWPEEAGRLPADPAAGRRFQSVLAQLLLREGGLSSREDPLVLTTADVNAFLAGHVEVRDPPVWPVQVRVDRDAVELGGATTVGKLLRRGTGLPAGPLEHHPLWVAIAGEVTLAGGRAEFVVRSATIGRQRVPVAVLWRLVGGRPPALTWRMPRVVERVGIEPGRVVLYTRRARAGGRSPGLRPTARLSAAPAALAQPNEAHSERRQHLL